jgi:hypothetical protein
MNKIIVAILINLLVLSSIHASSLEESVIKGKTWAVLGFVEDSEKGANINDEGQRLRKEHEKLIQKLNGEIYTMASSERMKLERTWSLPFTGRLSNELKAYAKKNQIGIITGSYNKSNKKDVSLLCFDFLSNKVKVYYTKKKDESKAVSNNIILNSRKKEKEQNNARSGFKVEYRTYESIRRRPSHLQGRRGKRGNKEISISHIKSYFAKSPVLNSLKKEFKNKSDEEKIKEADRYVRKASESWLTTSKIEYLSRAWALLDMVPSVKDKEKNKIIDSILEHEEFFADRNED